MPQTYKANGKLLLNGEYLVLDGAVAFAIPTKLGQELSVKESDDSTIHWTSLEKGKKWFEAKFDLCSELSILEATDKEIALRLQNILISAINLSKTPLKGSVTEIDSSFNLSWGLGSSSTLIDLISQWLKINPFELSNQTLGGSGYDIACARKNNPILYTREPLRIEDSKIDKQLTKNLFFVYSNQKQNSRDAIKTYKSKDKKDLVHSIDVISSISKKWSHVSTIDQANQLINQSEDILSEILQEPTLKNKLFKDYPHSIKSLGAWGGDFFMVTSNSIKEVENYFKPKGYETVLSFQELLIN